jgi:hypothetical protein
MSTTFVIGGFYRSSAFFDFIQLPYVRGRSKILKTTLVVVFKRAEGRETIAYRVASELVIFDR